ncbi:hypothetical protein [Aestuariibaculum sediminum]|uniref:Secreted protein n=1 Tax=Aestuariibaculum sediminum TaxID=2770637 RepID=A0A8J6PZD5_9FLAO|nr:hypothetical protein [Aestuariibaculum sediminum]MBD0831998.1 hypothetical protein [Aestuariibaculum sediminum]
MKLFSFYIFVFALSFSVHAQLDNKRSSVAIPAVETTKETDTKKIIPAEKEKEETNFGNLTVTELPKPNFNKPKNKFSLYEEEWGDPGELFKEQLDKNIADLKLSPEEVEQLNGSKTDQYFGDFRSKAEFVNVVYRDHGAVDGDLIQVRVNDDVVKARVFLNGGFQGVKIDLRPGLNKIDFVALNQGDSGPNTAEFRVVDDQKNLISGNRWNLATGVKASIIIVKE